MSGGRPEGTSRQKRSGSHGQFRAAAADSKRQKPEETAEQRMRRVVGAMRTDISYRKNNEAKEDDLRQLADVMLHEPLKRLLYKAVEVAAVDLAELSWESLVSAATNVRTYRTYIGSAQGLPNLGHPEQWPLYILDEHCRNSVNDILTSCQGDAEAIATAMAIIKAKRAQLEDALLVGSKTAGAELEDVRGVVNDLELQVLSAKERVTRPPLVYKGSNKVISDAVAKASGHTHHAVSICQR